MSSAYAEYPNALNKLSTMGPNAIDSASILALAIIFPRNDSYLAAGTLIGLGPDISSTTLPTPLGDIRNQRSEVRMYSVIILGSIGNQASCAVGNIAPLLWDADPYVRSAAASALKSIT